MNPWAGSSAVQSKGISPSLMLGVAEEGPQRRAEVPPWALPGMSSQG